MPANCRGNVRECVCLLLETPTGLVQLGLAVFHTHKLIGRHGIMHLRQVFFPPPRYY